MGLGDDVWRCDQYVVARLAINSASHWINHKTAGQCTFLDVRMELQCWVEWLLGVLVLHQFNTQEQSASANIANMGMLPETRTRERPSGCRPSH